MRHLPEWQWQSSDGSWVSLECADSLALEHKYTGYIRSPLRTYHRAFCTLGRKRQPHIIKFNALRIRNLITFKVHLLRRVLKTFVHKGLEGLEFGRGADDFCGSSFVTSEGHGVASSYISLASTFLSTESLKKQDAENSIEFGRGGDDFCEALQDHSQVSVLFSSNESLAFDRDQCLVAEKLGFESIVSSFCQCVDGKHTVLQTLCQQIDNMWLEEMSLEVCAELHAVVIEAAERIEHGANPVETINAAFAKAQTVRDWLTENLITRSANRDKVSLDGGFRFVEDFITERFSEIYQRAASLLQKLISVEDVSNIKTRSHKSLTNSVKELESIGDLKEANAHTMLCVSASLDETEEAECNFASSVVQAAIANPESLTLQEQAFEILSKIFDARAMAQRSGHYVRAQVPKFLRYVSETMRSQRPGQESLHNVGCRVLGFMVHQGLESDLLECSCTAPLLHAMEIHETDRNVQINACRALLDITVRDMRNTTIMDGLGAMDYILKAMSENMQEESLQEFGAKLVSVMVVDRISNKVLKMHAN